ncbi:hypothetical protein M9H77_30922 [Catharanthus roseus]|uniref:Uncharacterized protein n=1 Tax=Catharanthus roseus TaxID=4058 RepID=A0ACC0A0H2_CATRO|nr:hypothetical protein M9H77_30922 [Catharanthus roseus]
MYIYLLSSCHRISDLSTRSASRQLDFKFVNTYRTSFRPGLKFGDIQVNGRVSGLHCTWLVPHPRTSSDDVDGFLTLRVDPLNEGRSTWRAWANRYLRGYRVMLCSGTVA